MRKKIVVAGVVMALAAVAMPSHAGKLNSFEKSVGGSKSSASSQDSSSESSSDSSDSSRSLGSFESRSSSSRRRRSRSYYYTSPYYYHSCWYCRHHHDCLFHHYHHHHYHHDIDAPPRAVPPPPSGTNDVPRVEYKPIPGNPIMPIARFDFAWQAVEDDVTAYDYGLELGYSALALRGRMTHYMEDDPNDTLDLSSLMLLWRIPLTQNMELDAGFGGAELDGMDSQTGFDFSLALRGWVPDHHVGFEYRGEFIDIGDGLSSHEIGVLMHVKWFAVRGGYRWTHSSGDSLDGPFAGAALTF